MDSALHRIQGMIETTTRKCQAAEDKFNKPFPPLGLSIDILSDVSVNVIVATGSPSNINHNIEIDPAKSIVTLDPVKCRKTVDPVKSIGDPKLDAALDRVQ